MLDVLQVGKDRVIYFCYFQRKLAMKKRHLPALLLLPFFAACAQVPQKTQSITVEKKVSIEQQNISTESTGQEPRLLSDPIVIRKNADLTLPKQELKSEVLFGFLIAEFARQRGDLVLSAEAYSRIAQATRDPRLARRATEIAMLARLNRQALSSARLWVETDPTSPVARQTLTVLLVSNKNLDEAKSYIRELLKNEGEQLPRALLLLNNLFAKQTDKQHVLSVVQELVTPYQNYPEAHFAVAQAALKARDFGVAKTALDKVLKLKPDFQHAVILYGETLTQEALTDTNKKENYRPALNYYQDYLSQYPKSDEVRTYYARILALDHQYSEAHKQFQLLAEQHPRETDMLVILGLLSAQMKHYEQAESMLMRGLSQTKLTSQKNTIRLYLAQINEERQNIDEAVRWYGAIEEGDYYLPSQIRHASLLAKKGRLNEALTHLHTIQTKLKARNKTQEVIDLIGAEAQLLREYNQYQAAYQVLTQGLKQYPDQIDLIYDRALISEKLRKYDQAEKDLRYVIKIRQNYAHGYNALGYILLESTHGKRLGEAFDLIKKAHELAPADPFILDSLGWAYYKAKNNLVKAIQYLERAYGERNDTEIGAHLIEVLFKSGRTAEAQRLVKRLVEESPNDPIVIELKSKYSY